MPEEKLDAKFYAWLGSIDIEKVLTVSAALGAVADFCVSEAEDRPFVEFLEWINAGPQFIIDWRSDPTLEARSYGRFMQGLEACRSGYAASRYHLSRAAEIEDAMHDVLAKFDFSAMERGSTAAFGATRRLDYEYQAFVMAYRRSLDGLAFGLSTYFKTQQSSFRKFAKDLLKYHPISVGTALSAVCSRHLINFDFVMADERGTSVRDRIAHREAVQGGTINVGSFGTRLLGGGEELGMRGPGEAEHGLQVALNGRMSALLSCISDLLSAFRVSVSDLETA